jgi:reactive intermediate/imine deaminase
MQTIKRFIHLPLFACLVSCAAEAPDAPPAPVAGEPSAVSRVVRPDGFPAERPYAPGVLAGDSLYLSAQAGRDPATGRQPDGIAAQTRQAMENLGQVLKAAGMDYQNLVKCHVYLDSMDDYTGMNEVYGGFFSDRVPARTTVEAQGLPEGSGVQIGCIAHRDLEGISVVRPPQGSLPAPLGPYSAAVWAGDTLYLSGMGGQFPADRRLPEPLGEQVTQTLVNIETTLKAANLGFGDVVSSNVYVTVPGDVAELDAAYDPTVGERPAPPRTLIFLPRLPGAIKTEITFVARRGGGGAFYTGGEAAEGEDFDAQVRAVVRQLEARLQEAELAWRHVVHVQVYLADLADLPALDRVFAETFPSDPPARTVIQVMPGAPHRVQASLIAVR